MATAATREPPDEAASSVSAADDDLTLLLTVRVTNFDERVKDERVNSDVARDANNMVEYALVWFV